MINLVVEYCLRSRSMDRQMDRLRDKWTRQTGEGEVERARCVMCYYLYWSRLYVVEL